jgi:hypothetical protein
MMAKTKGNRGDRSAFSFDTARENPIATAAAVGGAVAAGVFLWSRRNQISDQISQLSDQIGEWRSGSMNSDYEMAGAGDEMMASQSRSTAGRRSSASNRRNTGMSETGGGNASLGRQSGGAGIKGNASSRGRARGIPSTT